MMINEIKALPPINIVTNSIHAVTTLEQSHHTVFLAGGQVLSRSMCTVGPEAEKTFHQIRPDKAFIGTTIQHYGADRRPRDQIDLCR